MMNLELWTDEELYSFASDYHKDCFNFRPRNMFERSDAVRIVIQCEDYINSMMTTESGRDQLRADGWTI
jgi:hypothetical protein